MRSIIKRVVYDEGTGSRTRLTGPNGLSTNWRINAFGRVTVELRADGNETRSYIKDCQGGCPLGASIVQISDQFYGANRTSVPQLAYSDNAGHVLRTQTWGFNGNIIVTDHAFDQLGRPENTYHPRFENSQAFKASTLQYDLVDRVIESTNYDANGEARRTTTSYDGYTTTMVNPRGQTRIETHNVAKQLVQVQDANNGFTKFSYDPFGNLTQTIDPENNVIVVDYDTLGRKTALKDPDLGVITYKVNPLGQTWAQISPKQRAAGQQTRFVFDKLGRMTGRIETDLESHWIFDTAPNGKGQLAEAYTGADNAAPSARTYRREHTYDEKGRPKKTTQSLRDASYTNEIGYDTWGRALTLSYTRSNGPSKSFYHRYNNMGYLAKIERAGLILWQVMQQDASHRVTLASLGNGLTQNRAYNPYTARLDTASLNNAVGEARVQEGYQYDSLGNVESRQQYWSGAADGFQEQYTYDSLNRLETTTMNNDTNARQVFTYDKTGNIKRKPNVSSGEYVYPTQGAGSVRPHAVSAIPGVGSFSYDANGNLENGAGRSITWKSFDMPFRITKGSQYSEFTYGPEHQRTYQTRNDGSKTEYAGSQEVETKDGILTIKTYWPGGLGVEIDKGNEPTKLLWMHQDRLGSQIAITDETGTLKEKLAFDAWGKRLNLNGIGTPDNLDGVIDNKGYTGHEMLDQLDLVHMNGRVYDPLVARFVSGDPHLTDPMNGQSYNRYAYVLNNPTNFTDPTGFDWKEYIPVYGSIKDFESSVGEGRFWTAAAFGTLAIVDGATLGVGQLATTPLKAAIKAGIKAEIKEQLAKEGVEEATRLVAQSAKVAERKAAKESAEKASEVAAAETKMAATGSERAKSGGTEAKSKETSRDARREAMRDEGIPTSQQPKSQSSNKSGKEYQYEVPKEGGGTQTKSVQQQTMDRSHEGQSHWEAGKVKTDPITGETRMTKHERPKLTNDKSKVNYERE